MPSNETSTLPSSTSASSPAAAVASSTSSSGEALDLTALRASLADAERTAQARLAEAKEVQMLTNNNNNRFVKGVRQQQQQQQQQHQRGGVRASPSSIACPINQTTCTASSKLAAPAPFVPPKQILLYLVRMGSFTSMPKVIPAADCDDTDLTYPVGREDLDTFLDRCAQQLGSLPAPIERNFRKVPSNDTNIVCSGTGEKIRVLQWNVLSQALGTKNDNFVRCPPSALYWRTRRFRMLEEVARHDADIICLQEVDHFPFLKKSLASLGYTGHFFPKPDSPCLYLAENSGPDGCAIFYKRDKFDLQKVEQRVIEVWHVESNQVVLMTTLRSCATGETFSVATTHLKARNGALLSTLRNEQGKDIMEFISKHVQQSSSSEGSSTPVIVTGDFNAEPTEPVYETMTNADHPLRLSSAYASASPSSSSSSLDKEAPYTTWKIREDGEHIQTLDYIFYSQNRLEVDSVLDFPSGHEIGLNRLPSLEYASDHFSLVADLRILPSPGGKSRN